MGKKETEEGLSQQNTDKIPPVARMDLRADEVEEYCHSYPDGLQSICLLESMKSGKTRDGLPIG
jgi:hypothetical protein